MSSSHTTHSLEKIAGFGGGAKIVESAFKTLKKQKWMVGTGKRTTYIRCPYIVRVPGIVRVSNIVRVKSFGTI